MALWGALAGAVLGGAIGGVGAGVTQKAQERALRERMERAKALVNAALGRRQANVEEFGQDMADMADREHATRMEQLQARNSAGRERAQKQAVDDFRAGTGNAEQRVLSGLPTTTPAQSGLQLADKRINDAAQADRAPTVELAETEAAFMGGNRNDAQTQRQLNFNLNRLQQEGQNLTSMFDLRDRRAAIDVANAREEAALLMGQPLPNSSLGQGLALAGNVVQAVAPMFSGGGGQAPQADPFANAGVTISPRAPGIA